MKLSPALFAPLALGFVFKPITDVITNDNQDSYRDGRLQPNEFIPITRGKRDLIGFNRQRNNIYAYERSRNSQMSMWQSFSHDLRSKKIQLISGDDIKTLMQTVVEDEKRTVQNLKEQAILNRIGYLKQKCVCWLICRGKYWPTDGHRSLNRLSWTLHKMIKVK